MVGLLRILISIGFYSSSSKLWSVPGLDALARQCRDLLCPWKGHHGTGGGDYDGDILLLSGNDLLVNFVRQTEAAVEALEAVAHVEVEEGACVLCWRPLGGLRGVLLHSSDAKRARRRHVHGGNGAGDRRSINSSNRKNNMLRTNRRVAK